MKSAKTNKSTTKKTISGVKNHFIILYVLFALAVVLTGLQFAAVNTTDTVEQTEWECIQTACAGYMSEGEVIDSVCVQTNGTYMCNVNVDGETGQVPLAQLNLSSVRFCNEYNCVKEARVRVVNYTLNTTTENALE